MIFYSQRPEKRNIFIIKLPFKVRAVLCQHSQSLILSELSGSEDGSEAIVGRQVSGETELGEEQPADLLRPSLGGNKDQAEPSQVRPPRVSGSEGKVVLVLSLGLSVSLTVAHLFFLAHLMSGLAPSLVMRLSTRRGWLLMQAMVS